MNVSTNLSYMEGISNYNFSGSFKMFKGGLTDSLPMTHNSNKSLNYKLSQSLPNCHGLVYKGIPYAIIDCICSSLTGLNYEWKFNCSTLKIKCRTKVSPRSLETL
jgi:hypothetical protein